MIAPEVTAIPESSKPIVKPVEAVSETPRPNQPKKEGENQTGQVTVESKTDGTANVDNIDIENATEQTLDTVQISPEAAAIGLRAIASKGDIGEGLILNGQGLVDQAKAAPAEGEGSLTEQQRQEKIALGCDLKIAGLEIRLSGIKNDKERQAVLERIKALKSEKANTKIEKNQLDDFARLFSADEKLGDFINDQIKNGSPMIAVEAIMKNAISNTDFFRSLTAHLSGLKIFSSDQIKALEDFRNSQSSKLKREKAVKTVGTIGMVSMLGMLLMMWSSSKEKKQGMG